MAHLSGAEKAAATGNDVVGCPTSLLVDDDEVNLLLTSIALRERGFSITEASSGEKAIAMLADWLPASRIRGAA